MKKNSALSLRVFLFAYSSSSTVITSFLPVYFQYKGFSATEIGWLLAVGPFASILSQPVAGYFSDKWKTVKKIMQFSIIGAILSALIMFQMNLFIAFLLTAFIFYLFLSPIGALGDSLAQKLATQIQVSFGSIRMWGSIGFAATSLLTGEILLIIGINDIMYPYLFFALITLIISFTLKDVAFSSKPVKVFDAFYLLKDKRLVFFLFALLFISTAHRVNDYYIGIYIKEIGGDESLIGWAWFIGVSFEALVFALSKYWIDRFNELSLIIFIGIVYCLRYVTISFIRDPYILLFFQALHGLTFPFIYAASLQYVSKIVPDYVLGTGHLLLITVFFGISGIIGSLFGGIILDATSGAFLYRVSGLIALIGSMWMLLYRSKERKRIQMGSNTLTH